MSIQASSGQGGFFRRGSLESQANFVVRRGSLLSTTNESAAADVKTARSFGGSTRFFDDEATHASYTPSGALRYSLDGLRSDPFSAEAAPTMLVAVAAPQTPPASPPRLGKPPSS